jgi:hypothetical protein
MSTFYEACLWICSVAFMASVPLLLTVRAKQPWRLPWWAVFILAAIVGWIYFNTYAYLEYQKNEAIRDEYNREHNAYALIDFFVAAPPSIALRWGWFTGVAYLGICLGMYGLFRGGPIAGVSRPVMGFLGAAVVLAAFLNCPPWSDFLTLPPFDFVAAYSYFLVCAGVSYHLLRVLRWEKAGYAFAVMFMVDFLILCTVDSLHSWTVKPSKMAAWAAMFGAVFTLLWWIAIRRRVPALAPDR